MSSSAKVHWQVEGQGPDLVLVHGWGMNGAVWSACVSELAEHFTVHTVDLPGYGYSHQIGYDSLTQLVDALLVEAPERAIWLGWSLGGLIATHIAHEYPARVSQLVTLASSPKIFPRRGLARD